LRPQILVPFWDIKESAKELERAHALGLRGVAIIAAPEAWGENLPDYGDPAWDPFWEVCSALDVPISFHVASGPFTEGTGPWKSFGFDPAKVFQGSVTDRGARHIGILFDLWIIIARRRRRAAWMILMRSSTRHEMPTK
jgi:hypothetical protein